MHPIKRHPSALGLLFLLTLAVPSFALAENGWDEQKGNCGHLFANYEGQDLPSLKQCLMKFEATMPTSEITAEDRDAMVPVLNHLYHSGDEEAQYYARLSMGRMQIEPSKAPAGGGKPKKTFHSEKVKKKATPKRAKYSPREASRGGKRVASGLVKKGLRQHKKGRYSKAADLFERALDSDGGSVSALYNGACAYAMQGDTKNAVEWLQRLVDIGTKAAGKKIRKARKDRDFDIIRDDAEFKRVVGFARVKVVNGVGEYGEDEVERIVKTLEQVGHEATDGGADKHDRAYPVVWYKKYVQHVAPVVKKTVNHPKTKYQVIDWDSEYDIIVSWGDIIRKNKFGEPIVKSYGPRDPDEAEKQMDDLLWEQDKALREPDKAARKVEHTASMPDRTQMRVETGARRVNDSVNRFESAGDKAGKLFK